MSQDQTLALSELVAQLERAIAQAQQQASQQFMQDLAQFFVPAPDQDPPPTFPQGRWLPRHVSLPMPREPRWRGPLALPQALPPEMVEVPLIALAPLRAYAVEQFELLTQLRLAWPSGDGAAKQPGTDLVVSQASGPGQTAEVKIVIRSQGPPELALRLMGSTAPTPGPAHDDRRASRNTR